MTNPVETQLTRPYNMMFAFRILFALVALVGFAAHAQPVKEGAEPVKPTAPERNDDSDRQQRRALLRASLKSLQDNTLARETEPYPTRQLSEQARADLRRQVRQQ